MQNKTRSQAESLNLISDISKKSFFCSPNICSIRQRTLERSGKNIDQLILETPNGKNTYLLILWGIPIEIMLRFVYDCFSGYFCKVISPLHSLISFLESVVDI
jgi:hypothetical protein